MTHTSLPFPCPLDHVLQLDHLNDSPELYGPPLRIRESSFLSNSRVPTALKVDMLKRSIKSMPQVQTEQQPPSICWQLSQARILRTVQLSPCQDAILRYVHFSARRQQCAAPRSRKAGAWGPEEGRAWGLQESARLLVPGHVTGLVPGESSLETTRHSMPFNPSDVQLQRALAPMSGVQVRLTLCLCPSLSWDAHRGAIPRESP